METPMYAIVQWIDKFTSIVNLEAIKHPRKPVGDYTEGEYITAVYGKKPYPARISEISEDKAVLVAKKTKDAQFPLKFNFEEVPEVSRKRTATDVELDEPDACQIQRQKNDTMETGQSAGHSTEDARPQDEEVVLVEDNLSPRRQEDVIVTAADVRTPAKDPVSDVTMSTSTELPTPQREPATTPSGNMQTPQALSYSSSRMRKLEKRVDQLEKELKQLKRTLRSQADAASEPVPGPSTSSAPKEDSQETLSVLLKRFEYLPVKTDKQVFEVIRRFSMSIFTREEILTCNRTGKRTIHSGDMIRMAFDPKKYELLSRAVTAKCETITSETLKKKFDNVLKMERRAENLNKA